MKPAVILFLLLLHSSVTVMLRFRNESRADVASAIGVFDSSGALRKTIASGIPGAVPACLKAFSAVHNKYFYFGRPGNASLGSVPMIVSVDLASGAVDFVDVSRHTDPNQFFGSLDYSDAIDALIFSTYGDAMAGTGQGDTTIFTMELASKTVSARHVIPASAYFDSIECLSSTAASQFLDWNPLSQNRMRSVAATELRTWTTTVTETPVPESQWNTGRSWGTDYMYSSYVDSTGAVYGLACLDAKRCPAVVRTTASWSSVAVVATLNATFPSTDSFASALDQNSDILYVAHSCDFDSVPCARPAASPSNLHAINLTSGVAVHVTLPDFVVHVEHIIA